MPRGDNPNSRKNLKPLQKGLPMKSQREVQRKGSEAGNRAKKEYASLTEALKDQCTSDVMKDITNMLIKRAKSGNLKAYEYIRDQMGEKPAERINIAQVDPETITDLKAAIAKRCENEKHTDISDN